MCAGSEDFTDKVLSMREAGAWENGGVILVGTAGVGQFSESMAIQQFMGCFWKLDTRQ